MANSLGERLKEWEQTVTVSKVNAADLQSLSGFTLRLEVLLPLLKEASVRQATLQAELQQATRDLDAFKKEANEMATRIRAGVKATYGYRAEKLVEFGLKPLRKRPKTKAAARKPQEAAAAPSAAEGGGTP